MHKTALIMAGGRGERFWPKSRRKLPKQFLSLTNDGKTMIQLTIERILPLVKIEDIFIVTNKEYKNIVQKQLPDIPISNIICEPASKNTAACIGLGTIHISKKYTDALVFVLPSDHLIKFNNMFLDALQESAKIAEIDSNLVTIGITPDYPETGYGYIRFNASEQKGRAYLVENFVEKPDLEHAKEYLATEEYLWNSGMFIWKVSTILNNYKQLMDNTYRRLLRIEAVIGTDKEDCTLNDEYHKMEPISIDYGIMEKAEHIYVIPGVFGWDDVGSWLSVERIKKSNEFGNVVNGNIITINTNNCIIQGEHKLIATIGLNDLIIVDSEDATLICTKDGALDIKKVIENLKTCNRENYL